MGHGEGEMGKPTPTFTIDDLLAELRLNDVPDGVTVRELCERRGDMPTKTNLSRIGRRVYDLIAQGLWEYVGKKQTQTVTGEARFAPAYRPKEEND